MLWSWQSVASSVACAGPRCIQGWQTHYVLTESCCVFVCVWGGGMRHSGPSRCVHVFDRLSGLVQLRHFEAHGVPQVLQQGLAVSSPTLLATTDDALNAGLDTRSCGLSSTLA
jgi:hypothetical protein